MQLAKSSGVTVFVVGHVNKEGAIAGPKVLEHMVDCELFFFEGEHASSYRILRAAKNRFGSTNEIGVFEMEGRGTARSPESVRNAAGRTAIKCPRYVRGLRDGGYAPGSGRNSGACRADEFQRPPPHGGRL